MERIDRRVLSLVVVNQVITGESSPQMRVNKRENTRNGGKTAQKRMPGPRGPMKLRLTKNMHDDTYT